MKKEFWHPKIWEAKKSSWFSIFLVKNSPHFPIFSSLPVFEQSEKESFWWKQEYWYIFFHYLV